MADLPCGCVNLYDETDPPEVRVEGMLVIPGCPLHDKDGQVPFSDNRDSE